jgi:tetratricopeptide (TPR) repeat protein
MKEAEQTANPFRLLTLGVHIKNALDSALRLDPESVEVRLDLVRFHMTAPGMIGGDEDEARAQAAEIARRDASLGSFARGYIAYREKEYGAARLELREAVKTAPDEMSRARAAKWLGWLSQETQQWDEAFAMWESLRASDREALYEIGRTAVFCSCELERGRRAVEEYLRVKNAKNAGDARKLLDVIARRQRGSG